MSAVLSAMDRIRLRVDEKAIAYSDWSRRLVRMPVGKTLDLPAAFVEMLETQPSGDEFSIVGETTTGKSTIAQAVIAWHQRQSGTKGGLLLDPDNGFSPAYAAAQGIDFRRLLRSNARFSNQVVWITEELLATGEIDLVVLDSRSSLRPLPKLMSEAEQQAPAAPTSDEIAALCKSYGARFVTTELTVCSGMLPVRTLDGDPEKRVTNPGMPLRFEFDPTRGQLVALGGREGHYEAFEIDRPSDAKVMIARSIEQGCWESQRLEQMLKHSLDDLASGGVSIDDVRIALGW